MTRAHYHRAEIAINPDKHPQVVRFIKKLQSQRKLNRFVRECVERHVRLARNARRKKQNGAMDGDDEELASRLDKL